MSILVMLLSIVSSATEAAITSIYNYHSVLVLVEFKARLAINDKTLHFKVSILSYIKPLICTSLHQGSPCSHIFINYYDSKLSCHLVREGNSQFLITVNQEVLDMIKTPCNPVSIKIYIYQNIFLEKKLKH